MEFPSEWDGLEDNVTDNLLQVPCHWDAEFLQRHVTIVKSSINMSSSPCVYDLAQYLLTPLLRLF